MKGRRPKPTALRLLQGNPGHRPIGDVMTAEPKPPVSGMIEPPKHMEGAAREFWYAQGPIYVKMRTLTDADWPVFEDLCELHAEKLSLIQRINVLRRKKKRTDKDEMELMTLEGRRRKSAAQFLKLTAEFGGTAASRPRCRVPSGQSELPLTDAAPSAFEQAQRDAAS